MLAACTPLPYAHTCALVLAGAPARVRAQAVAGAGSRGRGRGRGRGRRRRHGRRHRRRPMDAPRAPRRCAYRLSAGEFRYEPYGEDVAPLNHRSEGAELTVWFEISRRRTEPFDGAWWVVIGTPETSARVFISRIRQRPIMQVCVCVWDRTIRSALVTTLNLFDLCGYIPSNNSR